jgi:hypothetical protein
MHFKNVISKEKMRVWSCIYWNYVIGGESVQCEPSTDLTMSISCLLNKLGFLVHQYTLKQTFSLQNLILKHTNTHNFVHPANNVQVYDETLGSALYHFYSYTNIMLNTAH